MLYKIKLMYTINQRFEFLDNFTQMVIHGFTPSLIVTGEGGLGKSYSIRKSINNSYLSEDDYLFVKGYSTPRGLYNTLYDNNGKLIIFDDCDSILEDRNALNILKSSLDSYETRTISWLSRTNRGDTYPTQFDFTGRIIFISNKSKKSIDEALLTRSLVVDLEMSPDDKIDRMTHIIKDILPEYELAHKQDVLDFLKSVKDDVNLNIRMLIMITKMRVSFGSKWKDMAKYMILNDE